MSGGAGVTYDRYSVAGFEEWMMRVGPAHAPPVLFVPPLFEEMNRSRALIAATMRALAERGFGCWLPDLPGTGESERALPDVSWADWRHGVSEAADHAAAASGRAPVVAAIRGGCLLDDAAEGAGHWRLAPVAGASVAREMERSGAAGGVAWAGYEPFPALRTSLAAAEPAELANLRTLRLAHDRAEADAWIEGPALWRRSEPGTSRELAAAAAADIAEWAKRCAGS